MIQQWIELKDGELIAVVPGTIIKQLDPTPPDSDEVRVGYQIIVNPPESAQAPGIAVAFEDESIRNGVFQHLREQIAEGKPLIEWPGPIFGEVGPASPFEGRDEFEVSYTPIPNIPIPNWPGEENEDTGGSA